MESRIEQVRIEDLHEFTNHPFQVKDDEDMEQLVESVKRHGVLDPIIVRPRSSGGYEIISGHRRTHASRVAGFEYIPAVINEKDDDDATLTMIDANLHREKLLPSEKAFAYKMKMEALSHQGKKGDTAGSDQVGWKAETAHKIGIECGDSKNQVRRYIRLTELIPELLIMVDDNAIKFNAGVELSYLKRDEQEAILRIIINHAIYPTLNQTKVLRQLSNERAFTEAKAFRMLSLSNMRERKITITEDRLMQYFHSDMSDDEMKDVIYKLLDEWSRKADI